MMHAWYRRLRVVSPWRALCVCLPLFGLTECSHDFEFLVTLDAAGAAAAPQAGATTAAGGRSGSSSLGDANQGGHSAAGGASATNGGNPLNGGNGTSGRDGDRPGGLAGAGGANHAANGGMGSALERGGGAALAGGGAAGESGEAGSPAQGGHGGGAHGGAPQGGRGGISITPVGGDGNAGEPPDLCLTTPNICSPPFVCVKGGSCTTTWESASSGLTLNGNAATDSEHDFLLSDASGSEKVSSIFTSDRYSIDAFRFYFDYRVEPTTDADAGSTLPNGFTVTIERASPQALGQGAEGLGYAGISPSVALAMNEATQTLLLGENGVIPAEGVPVERSLYLDTWMSVEVDYDGTELSITLSNAELELNYGYYWTLDLPAVLGGEDAYLGVTAATGNGVALQRIDQFALILTP
ncbi:MAG TPA: hypothetical protein VMI54_14245 [Polyangiaceae bacterium]|nr:hypothetical protein [Polyangiaceae bacterium]